MPIIKLCKLIINIKINIKSSFNITQTLKLKLWRTSSLLPFNKVWVIPFRNLIPPSPIRVSAQFAERIFRLSQDAYTRAEMNDAGSYVMAQRQIVNCFIDGINDRSIKLKIMRHMQPDLNTVLNLASTEINLLKRFELRHGPYSNSPSRSGTYGDKLCT